ncbi:EKC/KEOPS complex subunit LAGE3-like [Eptesicus fuscus]|uniref:EKC/KEOPS complex subunit LAGE3-like n=1 Tax=Eptesicus fuscus TaxID=29078 RepID=UPI002403D7FB|nr:EKC/KEOPS complex subunit LAGE3-like [Eptesicus fuscus]
MDCEAAVQAAGEEDAGCTASAGGPAGRPGDQGGTGDPTSHGLLSDLEGQYGPRGPTSPGGPDTQSDPCSPPGQCGPGAPDNQGGLASPGGPGDEETMGAAAIDAPTVARALRVPGPGGYAISMTAGPENQKKIFKLTVPFRCSLEAEMARITMDDGEEQNPQQTVQREIKIKGTVLSVKWIADDFDLLRVSVGSFLEKLSVVMQNIQCIWPFIPRRVNRARRAGAEPGDPN